MHPRLGTFYREAFRCLKPGGWLEHFEIGISWQSENAGGITPESPIGQTVQLLSDAGKEKTGRTFKVVEDGLWTKYMEETGFVELGERYIRVPHGGWMEDPTMKQVGIFLREVLLGDLEGEYRTWW